MVVLVFLSGFLWCRGEKTGVLAGCFVSRWAPSIASKKVRRIWGVFRSLYKYTFLVLVWMEQWSPRVWVHGGNNWRSWGQIVKRRILELGCKVELWGCIVRGFMNN